MHKTVLVFFVIMSALHFNSCAQNEINQYISEEGTMGTETKFDTATFGAGCFWCVEAIFEQVKGVIDAESGYSGGTVVNPTYSEVCTGTTGHAEVCRVTYDPSVVTYRELLEVFWQTHDPTTLNRQGADIGSQYRSVIFYHNDEQLKQAEEIKAKLTAAHIWENPVVTEIVPFRAFYKAEDYHQAYYDQNASQPYCSIVITPKIEKFRKVFKDKLKVETP
jgi:peptide-methionine (S)-S-oxide reductase